MQVKTLKDYYEIMYEKFPDVPKKDIQIILNFGWRSFYLHNSYGGDVVISDNNFWCYTGYLKGNPIDHFQYYLKKLLVKVKVLFKRKRKEWDGYYYFSLTGSYIDDYLKQKKAKGRPRKNFTFRGITLYENYDECYLHNYSDVLIFRIPYNVYLGNKMYTEQLITDKAELIKERRSLTFKDILTYENEYDALC